ncbi:MAG: hypothetical protein LBL77_03675, partial [Endomicrobium sp.]|nr:hypothetical protein [Endomicrobium sp.]
MKKIISIIISFTLVLGACGRSNESIIKRESPSLVRKDIPIRCFDEKDKKIEDLIFKASGIEGKIEISINDIQKKIPESMCEIANAFYYVDGERKALTEELINVNDVSEWIELVCRSQKEESTKSDPTSTPTPAPSPSASPEATYSLVPLLTPIPSATTNSSAISATPEATLPPILPSPLIPLVTANSSAISATPKPLDRQEQKSTSSSESESFKHPESTQSKKSKSSHGMFSVFNIFTVFTILFGAFICTRPIRKEEWLAEISRDLPLQ